VFCVPLKHFAETREETKCTLSDTLVHTSSSGSGRYVACGGFFFTEFVSFVLNLVIISFIVKSWNLNMCFSCQ
jgi:hypothetical protein